MAVPNLAPHAVAVESPVPELAAATVLGLDGQVVTVGSLFQNQPAVLVFLRHFG